MVKTRRSSGWRLPNHPSLPPLATRRLRSHSTPGSKTTETRGKARQYDRTPPHTQGLMRGEPLAPPPRKVHGEKRISGHTSTFENLPPRRCPVELGLLAAHFLLHCFLVSSHCVPLHHVQIQARPGQVQQASPSSFSTPVQAKSSRQQRDGRSNHCDDRPHGDGPGRRAQVLAHAVPLRVRGTCA